MITPVTDKEKVALWILFSKSHFKIEILRDWINDRLRCVQFKRDNVPVGWAVYFVTQDGYLFVTYLTAHTGYITKAREELEDFAKTQHSVFGLRFQTQRSGKAWERLWPGFKTKYTIMERSIR